MRRAGRLLVEEDGDAEPLRHRLPHLTSERNAVGHAGSLDRDERHHVDRPEPRVLSLVGAKVDALDGDGVERQDTGPKGLVIACDRENAAVVVPVGLDVEHPQPGNASQGGDCRLHDLGPAPLADVGHALDQPGHRP
jgi:hypothetical protein